MPDQMDTTELEDALRRLGELVQYHTDIDMLLVGGAAGMLTGLLPPQRTTSDCDVMVYAPPEAWSIVEAAAADMAAQFDLIPGWLNSDVRLRLDTLPEGWERRRVHVGTYGRLRVFAASRPDLIAMKVIAGRPQDLVDIASMRVRQDDKEFVIAHLATLQDKGTRQDQIDDARALLSSLKIHQHE